MVITERGSPVGHIVPDAASVKERIETLMQAGVMRWNRKKPGLQGPVAKVRGHRTVADLLVEDRE